MFDDKPRLAFVPKLHAADRACRSKLKKLGRGFYSFDTREGKIWGCCAIHVSFKLGFGVELKAHGNDLGARED